MKLIWTDPSIDDLQAIRDYIARDSDYYAADLVEQLVLSVERLLQFPSWEGWFLKFKNENIRELVQQGHRIIYRLVGERIEILTIVHGSRDLSSRGTAP